MLNHLTNIFLNTWNVSETVAMSNVFNNQREWWEGRERENVYNDSTDNTDNNDGNPG